MDRALLVKNVVVSTVKTIKTLRGPGGALDRQRRRRPPAGLPGPRGCGIDARVAG
jgi:hypothetical protein